MVILDRNGKVIPGAPTADPIGRSDSPRRTTTTTLGPGGKIGRTLDAATFKHDLAQQIHTEVERTLEPLADALQSLDVGLALGG